MNLATSNKILLKLTIQTPPTDTQKHPESNHTFTFETLISREDAKNKIAVNLSRAKEPPQALSQEDMLARQSLLSRDKNLSRLHKDMVISSIMGEEEFWKGRQVQLS